MNDTKTDAKTAPFVISRTFNAPLARVWKAWTEPEQMAAWWGPKGFKADVKALDLKPGGKFHYLLESPQGQEMWGRMVFREIVPKERLVFINSFSDGAGGLARHPLHEAWPLQIHTMITFAEENGKTRVTVTWVPYEASESECETFDKGRDSMQGGWTGTFDKLENYLAGGLVSGAQEGAMKLNPYLNFPGNCEEAFKTYAKVLGGEIVAMLTYGEMPGDHPIPDEMRKKIAHARLIVGDQVLMASDAGPERFKPMQGVSVTLNIPEPAEAERVYNALIEGGSAIMPLEETFWARKFGVLVDRFGTQWMVNCEKPN